MAFSIAETSLSALTSSVKALASDGAGHVVGVGQDSVSIVSANGGASFTAGDIAYSNWVDIDAGGGRFVAVTDSDSFCAYSTDNGATFTTASIGAYMTSIAYGDSRWVACNTSEMKYSDNGGVSWTSVTPPESWSLRAGALIHNGSFWLVLHRYGNKAYISADGETWVANDTVDLGQILMDLTWDGIQFVGLRNNSNEAYTSADGITWVAHTLPVSRYWTNIRWNGIRFLGTAGEQSTNQYVTSLDGETWTSGTFTATSYWQSLTVSGTNIVAVSSNVTRALGTGDVLTLTGTAELPLIFSVKDCGVAELPLLIRSIGHGTAEMGIQISVIDPDVLSGVAPVTDGASAAVFGPVVLVGGVDVTDRVIGDIAIDAEEGTARIAELVLELTAGAVYLPDWTGLPVVISIADLASGVPLNALPLFSGKVDLPSIDLDNGLMHLRCTDDLQNAIDQMTRAQIDALVGGYWSPTIFDKGAGAFGYFNDQASTVAASIDRSPYGVIRKTDWVAKTVPDLVFGEGDILEMTLGVDMAERSGLINQVDIEFGYRVPKMKSEGYWCIYDIMTAYGTSFPYWVRDGGAFLVRAQVVAAIEAAGGTVESIDYTALPTVSIIIPAIGGGVAGTWVPNPSTDPLLCLGFSATVSFDYAQYIDETHKISVQAPKSIENFGPLKESMSGALEGKTVDVVANETSAFLYKLAISKIPPSATALVVPGYTAAQTAALTTDTDRAAANTAMETLIAIGKARIAATHRGNVVSFAVPLNPVIDLDKTIEVSVSGVAARGKVKKLRHLLSTDRAEATTEVDLAISAVAGLGITHPDDPVVSATTDADGATTPLAPAVMTWNGAAGGDQVITITFPGVEDAEREKAALEFERTVNAAVPEDLFTITI